MVDIAESKLHEAVERGEWRAVGYTLSTLGRDRGYTTKPLPLQDPFADQDARFICCRNWRSRLESWKVHGSFSKNDTSDSQNVDCAMCKTQSVRC